MVILREIGVHTFESLGSKQHRLYRHHYTDNQEEEKTLLHSKNQMFDVVLSSLRSLTLRSIQPPSSVGG